MTRYDQLREPGKRNTELEEALSQQDDGSYEIGLEPDWTCEPCRIPLYPFSADEEIYWQDESGYVVETETKKGHEIRNMAVGTDHAWIPGPEDLDRLYDRLVDITAGQIGDGELVVHGSMQTFPDHFHIVANTLDGDDLAGINDYALYDVTDGEAELVETAERSRLAEFFIRD